MPILVQSADEDAADEAALLARIVALETGVTALGATIADLQADVTDATAALGAIQPKMALYDNLIAALRAVLEA